MIETNKFNLFIEKFIDISGNLFFALVIPVMMGLLSTLIYSYFSTTNIKKENIIIHEFERTVIESLNDTNATIQNKELQILYEGVSKINKDSVQFNELYRKSLIQIYTNLMSGYTEREENSENRLKWAKHIYSILIEIEKSSPYDLLNSIEAQIFKDISFLSNSEIVNQKLKQLSQLYKARFDEVEEIKKQSEWSFMIGIGGFITGIMSIIISLARQKLPNKTEK